MSPRANDLVRAVCEALDAFRDAGLKFQTVMEENQFCVTFEPHDCFRKGVPHTVTWRLENYQMSKGTAEAAAATLREIYLAFAQFERCVFYTRVAGAMFLGPIYRTDTRPIRNKIEALNQAIVEVENGRLLRWMHARGHRS